MADIFLENQSILFIIYASILLFVNIAYLFDYRKIQEGLDAMGDTEELYVKTESFSLVVISLLFVFFRSWLFYFIVYQMTGNMLVLILVGIFILMDIYEAVFNTSIARMRDSRIGVTRVSVDTLFMTAFTIYYIINYIY